MPWEVVTNADGCSGFAVVKKTDGSLVACHGTDEAAAKAQVAALYANTKEHLSVQRERLALLERNIQVLADMLLPREELAAPAFVPDQHPRKGGKFAPKGQGDAGAQQQQPAPAKPDPEAGAKAMLQKQQAEQAPPPEQTPQQAMVDAVDAAQPPNPAGDTSLDPATQAKVDDVVNGWMAEAISPNPGEDPEGTKLAAQAAQWAAQAVSKGGPFIDKVANEQGKMQTIADDDQAPQAQRLQAALMAQAYSEVLKAVGVAGKGAEDDQPVTHTGPDLAGRPPGDPHYGEDPPAKQAGAGRHRGGGGKKAGGKVYKGPITPHSGKFAVLAFQADEWKEHATREMWQRECRKMVRISLDPNASPLRRAQALVILGTYTFAEDQARDDHGRFASEGGGGSTGGGKEPGGKPLPPPTPARVNTILKNADLRLRKPGSLFTHVGQVETNKIVGGVAVHAGTQTQSPGPEKAQQARDTSARAEAVVQAKGYETNRISDLSFVVKDP